MIRHTGPDQHIKMMELWKHMSPDKSIEDLEFMRSILFCYLDSMDSSAHVIANHNWTKELEISPGEAIFKLDRIIRRKAS